MPVPDCMLRPDGWVRGRVTLELPDCVVTPPLDGRTRMVPGGTPAAVNVTTPSDSGPDTIGNVGVGPMPVANASRLLVPSPRTQESTRARPLGGLQTQRRGRGCLATRAARPNRRVARGTGWARTAGRQRRHWGEPGRPAPRRRHAAAAALPAPG